MYSSKKIPTTIKKATGREAIADIKKYDVDIFQESLRDNMGACYRPKENQIVLGKNGPPELLEQALVHEARHLRQSKLGADELIANNNLDFASWMMIYRAKEADAYTQQIKACKEWEQIGHTAPMKHYQRHNPVIVNAYNKSNSPSDAFKAFYVHVGLSHYYEKYYGTNCLMRVMQKEYADKDISDIEYVSLKLEDIAKCCGGDRVDEFEEFMNGKEARQMHLLTKTFAELNDERLAASGLPHDPSLVSIPVRDFKDKFFNGIDYAGFCYDCDPEKVSKEETLKKETRKIITAAVNAVEKIDKAAVKGKTNPRAEKLLNAAKKRMGDAFRPAEPNNQKSLQSLLSRLGINKTAQAAALKKDNSR